MLILAVSATDNRIVILASRRNHGKLLGCGVKLYKHQEALDHQKVMTVDGAGSAVGSSNFDYRSFNTNDEQILGIINTRAAGELDRLFCELMRDEKPVSLVV